MRSPPTRCEPARSRRCAARPVDHPRLARQTAAFSLVELLVVIGIISLLMGLLLPAVQGVRAAARRTQISNGLRQMALATTAYAEQFGYFPPAQGAVDQDGLYGPPHFHILPFIEQQSLYDRAMAVRSGYGVYCWASNNVSYTAVPAYLSPDDPSVVGDGRYPFGTALWGQTSFAYNFQAFGNPKSATVPPYCDLCAVTPFALQPYWFGRMSQAKFHDGMTSTLMFAEKFSHNGSWQGANDGSSLWACEWDLRRPGFAIPGYAGSTGPASKFVTGGIPANISFRVASTSRSDGLVVARCDGGTGFLADAIAPSVWWSLVTSQGHEIVAPGDLP